MLFFTVRGHDSALPGSRLTSFMPCLKLGDIMDGDLFFPNNELVVTYPTPIPSSFSRPVWDGHSVMLLLLINGEFKKVSFLNGSLGRAFL